MTPSAEPSPQPSAAPSAEPSAQANAQEAELDAFIEDTIANVGMPGVETAVIKDGTVVWAKAYGLAVRAPLPAQAMTNDTILGIGGIATQLILVAFMQEVDAGTLGLDDDISEALPWPVRNPHYPDVPITWRMVFSDTASFNDDQRPFDDSYVFGTDSPVAFADVMRELYTPTGRYYSENTFANERPGTVYRHSDFAPALAAYAIELEHGKPFHAHVRERITTPLGMTSTGYFLQELPTERLGVGYSCDPSGAGFACASSGSPSGTVLDQQHSFPQYPIALLRTSASQYLKLSAMLANSGKVGEVSVLSKTAVDQLFEPITTPEGGDARGLYFRELPGWETLSDHPFWGNSGGDLGVAASVYLDRESRVAAMAIGNSQTSDYTNSVKMRLIVSKLLSEFTQP